MLLQHAHVGSSAWLFSCFAQVVRPLNALFGIASLYSGEQHLPHTQAHGPFCLHALGFGTSLLDAATSITTSRLRTWHAHGVSPSFPCFRQAFGAQQGLQMCGHSCSSRCWCVLQCSTAHFAWHYLRIHVHSPAHTSAFRYLCQSHPHSYNCLHPTPSYKELAVE